MAHQMSPPQRPPQRPYSPYQQMAHSPPGIALPPAKRQRLSPGASSPQFGNTPIPESPYGPYTASASTAASPPSFNTPQPYASSPPPGTMGPPPRPTQEKAVKEEKERITDISDITDSIWGSGVDLREEENYMVNLYKNAHAQQPVHQSFESGSVVSPGNSFNAISQAGFGNHPAFAGVGPVSQQPVSQQSVEAELDRKHKAAAVAYAKQHEYHLRDPFLQGNTVRMRTHRSALDQGVHLDVKGLFEPRAAVASTPKQPQIAGGVTATTPNGTAIASIQAQSIPEQKSHAILDESARFADILSLVSLAANERLRSLLDEAFTIARGRRYGSHGTVPPDLQDLAVGEGEGATSTVPHSITGTSWDKVPDEIDGATAKDSSQDPPIKLETSPLPTLTFSSSLSTSLQKLVMSDRDAEQARIRRRQERAQRRTALTSGDGTDVAGDSDMSTNPAAAGTSTPGTPTASGDPSTQPPSDGKPMTKKERERQAKMGQTEEVLHKNANVTAAMALGFGKKAKRYSWMGGGAATSGPTNPFAKPATPKVSKSSNNNSHASGSNTAGANGVKPESGDGATTSNGRATPGGNVHQDKGMQARERKWGGWREDGIEGRGIQMRDWVVVLERDGREKKSLERCFLKMDQEDQKGQQAQPQTQTQN